MPPITRSDTPYPLKTIDGTVDVEAENLLVTGDATFTGTVNIPGGVPTGPQAFFTATDTGNQYRTNNSAMEFRATGPSTTYSFKNSNENTTNNTVIAGSFQGNGTFDGEKTTIQSNDDVGTLASAGYKGSAGASTIDVLVGSVNNLPFGNRGLVRTAEAAGLDLQASGVSRNIRIKTDNTTRIEVDDTNTDIKNNLKATSGTVSTTTTTGAITVTGGVGISGNLNVGGTITGTTLSGAIDTPFPIKTSNVTNSSSTTTGALISTGGLGVGLDVNVGGNVKAVGYRGSYGDTFSSDSALTNSKLLGSGNGAPLPSDATYLYTPGNSATSSSSYVLGVNTEGLSIPATTQSTSTSTGAIVTPGGVGISKDLNVGGTISGLSSTAPVNTTGTITTSNTTASVNSITGALTVSGGVGIGQDLNVQGNINATQMVATVNTGGTITTANTTASTNPTTGALKVAGGAGVVGNLNVGGEINATLSRSPVNTTGLIVTTNSTASIDPFSGSLVAGGGVGIAGKVNVANDVRAYNFMGLYGDTYQSDPNLTNSKLLGSAFSTPIPNDATYLFTPGNSATSGPNYVLGVNSEGLQIPATVNSTSPTTGSIRTAGGLGIAQDLSVGGNINLTGSIITSGSTTFVPTFKNSGFGITYTSQVGEYYRIGKMVWLTVGITTTSAIDNVVSDLTVQGLPLPCTSLVGAFGTCAVRDYGIGNAVDYVSAVIAPGAPSEIIFQGIRDNLGVINVVSPTTAKVRELYVSMVYIS